jgi:acetyl esterase/lipase
MPVCGGCAGSRIRAASDEVRTVPDLAYVAGSADPKQQLDLYLPRHKSAFPMVLFVHGGFWRNQDRRYHQGLTGLYGNVGVALARRGVGVAVQSYRLSPAVGIEAQLGDVVAAAGYTLAHAAEYGGDPRQLFLAGYSAGGQLITTLCAEPERLQKAGVEPSVVRGCVSLSGVLDLVAMAEQQDADFNRDVSFRLFGQSRAEQERYSPAHHLRAEMPPMLLFTAAKDYRFVKQAGSRVAEQLRALGAQPTLIEVPGYSHADMVLNINSSDDLVSEPLAAFVQRLRLPPAVATGSSAAP